LGLTAKAAEAAAEKGIQYYSAAGNTFDNSYETTYKGIPCPPEFSEPFGDYDSCHDFGGGNVRQRIDVRSGGNVTLYWDQPWASLSKDSAGAQLDFDFYLINANDDPTILTLASSSVFFNVGADAFEEIVIERGGLFDIVIPFFKDSPLEGDGALIKWISFGPTLNSVEPGPVNGPTLTGPANTPNVAAVAAAFSQQTFGQLVPESFTALGGIPMLFDNDGNRYPEPITLPQPRFTGPDGYVTIT